MTTREKLAEAARVVRVMIADGRGFLTSAEHDALSLLCSAAEGVTVGEERERVEPGWNILVCPWCGCVTKHAEWTDRADGQWHVKRSCMRCTYYSEGTAVHREQAMQNCFCGMERSAQRRDGPDAPEPKRVCCGECRYFAGEFCRRYPEAMGTGERDWCGEGRR